VDQIAQNPESGLKIILLGVLRMRQWPPAPSAAAAAPPPLSGHRSEAIL